MRSGCAGRTRLRKSSECGATRSRFPRRGGRPADPSSRRRRHLMRLKFAGLTVFLLTLLSLFDAGAQAQLACGHFIHEAPPAPAPRGAGPAVRRFELINAEVKSVRHRVLYLGDSLTERWDQEVWREYMVPRG